MRKLTRAAYAKSAYDAFCEIGKISITKAKYDDRATWRDPRGVFSSACFSIGVCRCLTEDVLIENTPLFFSAQVG